MTFSEEEGSLTKKRYTPRTKNVPGVPRDILSEIRRAASRAQKAATRAEAEAKIAREAATQATEAAEGFMDETEERRLLRPNGWRRTSSVVKNPRVPTREPQPRISGRFARRER